MRILQINASYKPAYVYGGPTMSVSKLNEQLVKAGLQLEVFTTTANGKGELNVISQVPVTIDGVKVTYFKRLTKDHSHLSPALLKALWQGAKHYDVIHIHAWWNLVSMLSCLIAVLRGGTVVLSPRGTLSDYSFRHKNLTIKKIAHSLFTKPLIRRSFIHVTSESEQRSLSSIVDPKLFFNIPNFVQLAEFEANRVEGSYGIFKLLFLSRIDEKKGLDVLLGALAKVSCNFRLTVVGDGDALYIDQLKNIAKQNNIDEYISWLGFQHGNKFELFKQHDLFILPSHNENFGNVVIESLSVGTAVAISQNVGLADYVATNDLGWVFELDTLSLAKVIDQASQQKGKLDTIRIDGPYKIRTDFDEDKLTQQYIAMYHEILNHG